MRLCAPDVSRSIADWASRVSLVMPSHSAGSRLDTQIDGGDALNREYRSRGGRGDLVAAARCGDPTAASLVVLAAEVLGEGLADADALVELDRVALGGGLGTALGDLLLLQLKERCPTIEFVMAELGDAAGAIGAAYAAAEQNGR